MINDELRMLVEGLERSGNSDKSGFQMPDMTRRSFFRC